MNAAEEIKKSMDAATGRVEKLNDDQRSRLLYRLCFRAPDLVNTALDEYERTEWRWGE